MYGLHLYIIPTFQKIGNIYFLFQYLYYRKHHVLVHYGSFIVRITNKIKSMRIQNEYNYVDGT